MSPLIPFTSTVSESFHLFAFALSIPNRQDKYFKATTVQEGFFVQFCFVSYLFPSSLVCFDFSLFSKANPG